METTQPPTAPAPEQPATKTPAQFTQPVAPSPNLLVAIVAGLVAAVLGAAIWAGIAFMTNMTIGYIAIGVGFLVGLAIRVAGHGAGPVYGVIGGVLAFVGCLLGDMLTVIALISKESHTSFFSMLDMLSVDLAKLVLQNQEPMGWIIYAIAVYFGFKYSSGGGQRAAA